MHTALLQSQEDAHRARHAQDDTLVSLLSPGSLGVILNEVKDPF